MLGSKEVFNLSMQFDQGSTKIAAEMFAIQTAINLISGCIAKCEFKTYLCGKENKGQDYYNWNFEPNINQNSTEFISKLINKLLFNGEALVITCNGQYIVVDSFTQKEYALLENYFENVTVKDFTFRCKFNMSDVFYFKLNDHNITTLLDNLIKGYDNLMNMALGKYKRAGGRKGTFKMESIPSGDTEKGKKLKKLFDEDFKEYFQAENAVLPLYKGDEYTEIPGEGSKKSTSELTDIRSLLEEEFIHVAQAYKIPPALLLGNIANVSEVTNNLLTFCIDPITDLLQTEINRKLYGKAVLKGSKMVIDTTCILHVDVFTIADKIDKLLSDGIYSIDEIRAKIKESSLNKDWSEKHWITKNLSEITKIDDVKGGEN